MDEEYERNEFEKFVTRNRNACLEKDEKGMYLGNLVQVQFNSWLARAELCGNDQKSQPA